MCWPAFVRWAFILQSVSETETQWEWGRCVWISKLNYKRWCYCYCECNSSFHFCLTSIIWDAATTLYGLHPDSVCCVRKLELVQKYDFLWRDGECEPGWPNIVISRWIQVWICSVSPFTSKVVVNQSGTSGDVVFLRIRRHFGGNPHSLSISPSYTSFIYNHTLCFDSRRSVYKYYG